MTAFNEEALGMSGGHDGLRDAGLTREISMDQIGSPDWDAFVERHPDGHHVQSDAWASFQMSRRRRICRVALRREGRLVGAAQVAIKAFGALGAVGYLDRGPLVAPGCDVLESEALGAIRDAMSGASVRMLVTRPPSESMAEAMLTAGFIADGLSPSLPATTVVDLAREPDAILAAMRAKTRYNIRKALKSGLRVRVGGGEGIETLVSLLAATASRQGFVASSPHYFEQLFAAMEPARCRLISVEDDDGTISSIVLVGFGDTVVYKRGAWSGRAGGKHPNELAHWAGMQWARQSGYRWYDFDGIDREAAESVLRGDALPSDAASSVTRFKLGFGGEVRLLPRSLVLIPSARLARGYAVVQSRFENSSAGRRLIKQIQTR